MDTRDERSVTVVMSVDDLEFIRDTLAVRAAFLEHVSNAIGKRGRGRIRRELDTEGSRCWEMVRKIRSIL